MMTMPGPGDPGFRADPGSDTAAVPQDFAQFVIAALWARQIDVTKIPPAQLDKVVNDLWSNQLAQDAYNSTAGNPLAQYDTSFTGNMQTVVSDLLFSAQSSDRNLFAEGSALRVAQGQTLTAAERAALGTDPLVASSEQVPNPFGQFTAVSGNDYGQAVDPNSISGGYGATHLGVDYGTPEGTLISAPFAGTVSVERNVDHYGNLVTLTLPNGWKLRFGHVADGLASGAVQPGQVIARSGANVGTSVGAVTLVEWMDPSGQLRNPHEILDSIQQGVTFSSLEGMLGKDIAGTGISHSTALDTEFPGAKSAFAKYFGRLPTDSELVRIATAGGPNQDVKAMEDYVRALPSHIPGILEGQYFDLRGAADAISAKLVGHDSTDGIVKELFDAGHLTDQAITNWYNTHTPNQLKSDPAYRAQYNSAYAANQPYYHGIYNESKGADPRILAAQVASVTRGSQFLPGEAHGIEPSEQAAAAASLPAYNLEGWDQAADTPPPADYKPGPTAPTGGGVRPIMNQ